MHQTLIVLGALVGALSLTTPATVTAQDGSAPDVTYEFGDENVEGGYRSPLIDTIVVRQGAGRTSLVRPRVHFVPELLKSVETL